MQIKKMKETGQQSCSAGALGGRGALSMSPKQPSSSRAPRPERPGAPALLFRGAEAEATLLGSATCTRCRSVYDVPLQDADRGPGPSRGDDGNVCFRCNFRVAPAPSHYGSKSPSPAPAGQDGPPASGSASSKFKVRNFKPGKHYCDKCRFSTKDPLQYRKHTLQHEEIKFICSHCSCVSYTKGEFQRHLVKHTGVFPYRCEYCDYGAVRNDYIVKHRKRVHERPAGATLPSKVSEPLSKFPLSAHQDKMRGLLSLPEPKGYQKDVVCVPNRGALAEPSEAGLFENKSVEVEVLSPAREPVQPGVPLTVVAPAELVVPANCLAQLMDVKVVNGTQQLVLKLFPLEESNGLEPAGGGDAEQQKAGDKGSGERETVARVEPTKALALEGGAGRLAGLHRLQASVQRRLKDMKWVRSYDVFMANPGVHGPGESPFHPEAAEDPHKRGHLYLHRTELPAFAFKGPLSPSVLKNSVLCDLGTASNSFPYKPAAAFAEDGRSLHREAPPLFPFSLAAPASADKGLLPTGRNGVAPRRELGVPARVAASARKLGRQPEEPRAAPGPGRVSSPPRGEHPTRALAGEDGARARPPADSPWDLKNPERTSDTFDGPIISSVFSLSSGSENVPEGVKWNSSTSKIKSIELLRKKIAKLIESCGRPPSLGASHALGRPAGQASKTTSKTTPEGHGEVTSCSSGTLLKPRGDGRAGGLLPHPQVCPPFADGRRGDAEDRATRKAHVATPVLIPKGAVLRVLNSSEDAHIIEATCDTPVSIPCSKTQLVKPTPFCPVRHAGSRALPAAGGLANMFPDPDLALRPKPRKESAFCSLTPKKTGPLQGQQASGALGKPGKLLPRSLPASKNKSRQVNPPKKRSKMQPDPSRCLKDPAILQVARQLRLVAAKPGQLIKCPRRNQPVIVLNHPDVDSPEVTNVMKVINKYKGNVLKVVLSERTRCQLGIRRHHVRLTYQNVEEANQIKRQMMLKMKLKKVHKNNYQVVRPLPDDAAQCIFKCWFCGRLYEDQEEWMSHGQRHLIEATRDWDVLSSKVK
ncbi:PREDICTED: zinc finger protein 518B [Condylura cristata]|uniref:zinc finger protein 518B n=1 Tax=Condylura cristata TaxID=143302 RepID=UPI000642BBB3|nr:PREDICTED: zinc finger protein 518B [Condylura cristata]